MIWFWPLLIIMFFAILLYPIEKTSDEIRVIAGTRTDWGYSSDYCDRWVTDKEGDITRHYKQYCNI